ncbi:MAG: ABC transporter ATP-binding protein [Lentisphaeria bacterium]|nr:ABC transporter ATP-binding protein [Lentisphaeria bacterium]
MIQTENLTRKFGAGRGVFDINLHVPKGSIYGFIGHNGAGKTTAIKMLCGLLKPTSGSMRIGNYEVVPKNLPMIKRMIGYMPDITGVYEQMSVWEFLDFYGAAFKIPPKQRKERIEAVLAITKSENMIDYQVASLSRGMRQRIGLAKTLIHDPEVLILDEPAGGLDPNARVEMRRTIKELKNLGKTILLSSHILPELASICDIVGILNKGKLIAQGTVKEINDMLHETLSISVTVDSDLDKAMALTKAVEGVVSVQLSDINQFFINYRGSRETTGTILSYLMQNGVRVRWFTENEADLENVYLNITQDSDTGE